VSHIQRTLYVRPDICPSRDSITDCHSPASLLRRLYSRDRLSWFCRVPPHKLRGRQPLSQALILLFKLPASCTAPNIHIRCSSYRQSPDLCKRSQVIRTPWPESASELYRPSDRRLSSKLVPTFADRGCHVVTVTDPYCRIVGFLDRSCYFFFQVAPQLYSRGWVDPVPDPLLLRKSGSAGNRSRTSGSVARNSDH
jgi:hypothetical protein